MEQSQIDSDQSIEPALQFCVFCDIVAQGPGNKPVFVGVFDQLLRLGPIPQFFVAIRWINGLGDHTSAIRLLDPDLQPIFTYPEKNTFSLKHRAQAAGFNYGIINFTFPRAGVYWVDVILNDHSYASFPMPVYDNK